MGCHRPVYLVTLPTLRPCPLRQKVFFSSFTLWTGRNRVDVCGIVGSQSEHTCQLNQGRVLVLVALLLR